MRRERQRKCELTHPSARDDSNNHMLLRGSVRLRRGAVVAPELRGDELSWERLRFLIYFLFQTEQETQLTDDDARE